MKHSLICRKDYAVTPLKYDGIGRFLLVWLSPHILLIRTLNQCPQTVPSLTPPPLKKTSCEISARYSLPLAVGVSPIARAQKPGLSNCSLKPASVVLALQPGEVSVLREQAFTSTGHFPQLWNGWGSAAGLRNTCVVCSGDAQPEREGKVRRAKRLGVLKQPFGCWWSSAQFLK